MVASRIRLSRPDLAMLPPTAGLGAGIVVAATFAFMPANLLNSVVASSGIVSLLPVAVPPLGITARALLALTFGTGAGAITWAALFLLFGPGGVFAREGGRNGMPSVRSADAHPDAPARRPLSAADLSSPIADARPVVERPLPVDLDEPLAAFDPHAILAAPREPVRAVSPLVTAPPLRIRREPLAPGERISSVEIPPPHASETDAPSIESLLARLERGTERRALELRRAG